MSTDSEDAVLEAIRETLLAEGRVDLPGWGTLSVRHENARIESEGEGWRVEPPREGVTFEADAEMYSDTAGSPR